MSVLVYHCAKASLINKSSEDLRRRFVKAESTLFRVRYDGDATGERELFLNSRDFNWIAVSRNF